MFDDETPIAWSALRPGVDVVSAEAAELGTVENVLGDRDADIFHSVLVKRTSDGAIVEIPAARVHRITERHVVADVAPAEANALPAYRRR